MFDTLQAWDYSLLQLINQTLSNDFFDLILPPIRTKETWFPLYGLMVAFLLYRYSLKGVYVILGVALTVAVGDGLAAKGIKPTVERTRPCQDEAIRPSIEVRISCGPGKSFVSNHATNHFAVAVFFIGLFARRYRWLRVAALIWAGLISYAQVYVGVHYPFDVLAGAVLGSLIGYGIARLLMYLTKFDPYDVRPLFTPLKKR